MPKRGLEFVLNANKYSVGSGTVLKRGWKIRLREDDPIVERHFRGVPQFTQQPCQVPDDTPVNCLKGFTLGEHDLIAMGYDPKLADPEVAQKHTGPTKIVGVGSPEGKPAKVVDIDPGQGGHEWAPDIAPVSSLDTLDSKVIDLLTGAGYENVQQLFEVDEKDLTEVQGIGKATAGKIKAAAQEFVSAGKT